MSSEIAHFFRIAKRVTAAVGYLELGMSEQVLASLENLGDLGPFEAEVELLRGQAFRLQHRFEDAAMALKTAATKFPAPQDKSAWLALSICYHQAGDADQALQMLARAGAQAPNGTA